MIQAFTEVIRDTIEGFNWVGNYGGLCYPVSRKMENGTTQTFPVPCNATDADCKNIGTHYAFTPDSNKKSVCWFEQRSSITRNRQSLAGGAEYQVRVRFICWMNLNKLGLTGCGYDEIAALQLINGLGREATASSGILENSTINIDFVEIVQKDPSIFQRYSFNELDIPYLFKPYDYFAIDFNIRFMMRDNCLPEITLGTEMTC